MMSFGNGISDLKQALSTVVPVSETKAAPRSEPASTTSETASDYGTKTDEASLSTTSGLIAQALEGSDVRTAKVEALRQAIANGSYQVPSAEVAGKIIQSITD
jgi:negative regulator of flagellin synthesis FlgM